MVARDEAYGTGVCWSWSLLSWSKTLMALETVGQFTGKMRAHYFYLCNSMTCKQP